MRGGVGIPDVGSGGIDSVRNGGYQVKLAEQALRSAQPLTWNSVEANDMWVGLRALRLVDSVLVDDRSEIVVDFCLRELVVEGSSLPSRYLLFIVESSSASITKLDLRLGPGFDWSPLTSLSSLAFPQLEDLTVVGVDTPPPAFLSRCGTLKRLALFRITSNVLDPLAQIRQELSPLPNPTLVEMTLGLRNVPRNTGVVTQEDVEKMIEIPSLANLECLMLFLACSMDGALIDAVTGIKGKKGKLVVTVDVCERILHRLCPPADSRLCSLICVLYCCNCCGIVFLRRAVLAESPSQICNAFSLLSAGSLMKVLTLREGPIQMQTQAAAFFANNFLLVEKRSVLLPTNRKRNVPPSFENHLRFPIAQTLLPRSRTRLPSRRFRFALPFRVDRCWLWR